MVRDHNDQNQQETEEKESKVFVPKAGGKDSGCESMPIVSERETMLLRSCPEGDHSVAAQLARFVMSLSSLERLAAEFDIAISSLILPGSSTGS